MDINLSSLESETRCSVCLGENSSGCLESVLHELCILAPCS